MARTGQGTAWTRSSPPSPHEEFGFSGEQVVACLLSTTSTAALLEQRQCHNRKFPKLLCFQPGILRDGIASDRSDKQGGQKRQERVNSGERPNVEIRKITG
jgi:hypothetical protein